MSDKKWHSLDEELDLTMRQPLAELAAMRALLDQNTAGIEVLDNMCRAATTELREAMERGTHAPACEDVLEHCLRAVVNVKRVHRDVLDKLDATRRFVARATIEHHDAVMPHISEDEARVIHAYNPFVVRY